MIATGVTVAVTPASGTQSPSSRSASRPAATSVKPARQASSCFFIQPAVWVGSAYLAGYSDVAKLKGSALLGPGYRNQPRAAFLDLHGWRLVSDLCNNTLYQYTTGGLDYGKSHLPQFPPATTTFLSFGFMPTTATLQLTQVPINCRDVTHHLLARAYQCIVAASNQSTNKYIVTATSELKIRIYDVLVNGVRLNVGNNCHTVSLMNATLQAASDNQYDVLNGGILQGSPTIPPWTGCGVRENLDAIFDAAISGKGNFTLLTQGPTCAFWTNPPIGLNGNCRIPPGRGHPYGVPKYFPKPRR